METKESQFKETECQLYVIYSRWSIKEIELFLNKYGNESTRACMRIDYVASAESPNGLIDTNRTFILLKDEVVEKLKKDGYHLLKPGFSFSKFKLRSDFILGCKSLCIPLPKTDLTGFEIKELVKNKMGSLVSFGVVLSNDFEIILPLLSREADVPKNTCYINFDSKVPDDKIIVIRTLLNYTMWGVDKIQERFMCHYVKVTKPTKKKDYFVSKILKKNESEVTEFEKN